MRLFRLLPLLLLAAPALAGSGGDYAAGAAAFARGDVRGAQAALVEALRADPGNGAAHRLQGRVYLALDDGVGAEAELRRALDAGIPVAALHHLLADALVLQGAPDRALDEAQAAPPRYAAYAARMRGRALAALDRGDEARVAFEQAVRIAPASLAAWADLARFRADAGDAAGATAAIDRALALDPRTERWERSGALIAKGRLVRSRYGLAEALPWFDRAVAADKGDALAWIERAATLGDLGEAGEALAATRAALALGGNNSAAFYLQAAIAARAKDWRLARLLIDRVDEDFADQPGAILLAGTIELNNGNIEQAIERFSRLVAMQPDNFKARRLLALAQWRAGDADATVEALRPIVDLPAADSYALTLAGRALERLGNRAAAASYLDRAARPMPPARRPVDVDGARRAAALSPADAGARLALVRSLAEAGQGAEALAQARAAEAAFPGLPAAYAATGDVLMAMGRPAEAADAYARSANVSFAEPIALRMIDALRRSGRVPAAGGVLELLLTQYPRSIAGRLAAAEGAIEGRRWPEAAALLEGVRARTGASDPTLLCLLAWTKANGGALDEGLAAAQAARRLAPANPAVNDMLGWLLWRSGKDRARGLALLAEAAAQAPGDVRIRSHVAATRTR